MRRPRAVPTLLAGCLLLTACRPDTPAPSLPSAGRTPDAESDRNLEGRVYERNVVFVTAGADSAIVVPWLFRSSTSSGGVERSAEGWLARAGLWESFFADRWSSPPSRTPFRIHPRGPMDLVVGPGDVLERILFEEGPRQMEVVIEEGISDWTGNRGEAFRIHRGEILLGDRRLEGMVLDMTRVRRLDSPADGEWMFLTGPRRLAVVTAASGGSPTRYTAWGRLGDAQFRWPEVEVEWSSVRSFEEARRDVPVAWTIRSADGELDVTLRSTGMDLRAGIGDGPLLPVEGLYQVSGEIVIGGDSLQVRGFVHHVQR